MPEPLEDYRRKRDFQKTPEPAAGPAETGKDRQIFVVHRHEARRLHYDLRLELDGVLCSFAVPKGFSYNPKEKRLAVRTEDHPMEYEHFEGVIPKGQYGAGTMLIWDRGTYEWATDLVGEDAMKKGELKLTLRGRKLRGEWHMVKLKDDPKAWLLFKSKDRYAGSERDSALGVDLAPATLANMPRSVTLMQSNAGKEPFTDPAWLFEMEFTGRRLLAEKNGDEVRLRGLPDNPATERVLRELEQVAAENALLDGVLVALDGERPSRDALDAALAGEGDAPLCYYAFDLLYFDDFDLRPLPLLDRKAALRAVVQAPERSFSALLYVDHVAGNGESLAEAVAQAGLPSMLAKRSDSPYEDGASKAWLQIPVASDPQKAAKKRSTRKQSSGRVTFSNLGKVFWPAEGFTKGDMLAYYEQVADVMLPHLHGRPVHMNRFPDGIDGKSFYQKEAKSYVPDWVERVPIHSERSGETVPYMVCNDRDTLLYLANLGSIDLHPWLSRRGSLLSPDWAVLDLDPKEAPFAHVVRIAREIGKILRGIGLTPYLKTSGKTGLHIYVPLLERYTYDHSRMFCEGVARLVSKELRDIATVERDIGAREGKVYVDFLQNRRGQTVVPPYCLRPVRGATVSAPLHWDELDSDLSLSQFTIQTILPRLEQHGDLFRPVLTDRQDLMPAIEALQDLLR